jgi:hypothetical protein
MKKTQYLLRSIATFYTAKKCPYCQQQESKVLDSKYLVTTLNECEHCKLLFRHPADSVEFNRKFYQEEYKQDDGITTDLPTDEELKSMLEKNFEGSGKDYRTKIKTIKKLTQAKSILDYGANWGYTSYQFQKEGMSVQAYEISKPRANFGKKLGVTIRTDEKELTPGIDVFFSSHVIEHVPSIKHMFQLAQSLLNEDGYFVAYCPNGSAALRKNNPKLFHNFWGQVHPNLLSAEFFSNAFRDVPYLIGSEASGNIEEWDGTSQRILNVSGNELFVFAKIKKQVF